MWRCLRIWGAHAGLLLATIAILSLRQAAFGLPPTLMAPLMRDGLDGVLRGLTLVALPNYLDILPLYIVFLMLFPVIWLGMRRSAVATLLVSVAVYMAANAFHYNLPNAIDPRAAATWNFNPFTWQLIYVTGVAFALAVRRGHAWLRRPPRALLAMCWAYLLFAFVATNSWNLWPSIFADDSAMALLGNEPKCFLTPWRLVHALALVMVLLTAPWFARLSSRACLQPFVACGRHSLPIFSAGCVLALLGRIAFLDFGPSGVVQVVVNVSGLMGMLLLAAALDARASGVRAGAGPEVAVGGGQGASICVTS